MAQKTEKEETEFKSVPETITFCINNCGVTGNPSTNNMCQNCFNSTTATSSSVLKFSDQNPRSTSSDPPARSLDLPRTSKAQTASDRMVEVRGGETKREVSRCSGCRRKVGLTGFRCRCGELFCSDHRYSDRHDCSFDYKAAGRDRIARENPVVKAAKIFKV